MMRSLSVLIVLLMTPLPLWGQFVADFDDGPLRTDPRALDGWTFFTGDGAATMDFVQGDGYASVRVDATGDTLNIWWALVKRAVSDAIDLERLSRPEFELRVEARVRTSAAPRRINLHVNTQRTTDFHSHLMEYDLADTARWHTVSMTTTEFDARPGDTVNVQLALMDWGLDRYRLDIDDVRVDVVDPSVSGPDLGEPIPYHGPTPPPDAFAVRLPAAAVAVVDEAFPDLNFSRWASVEPERLQPVVAVGGSMRTLLRWDFGAYRGRRAAGPGLLALPTRSFQRALHALPELRQIRVVEILGGDPNWERETVTFRRFTADAPLQRVLNPQMIVDVVPAAPGDTTWITVSRPVLQRLLDGKTHGIALQALGPVHASFEAAEDDASSIRLLFDVE